MQLFFIEIPTKTYLHALHTTKQTLSFSMFLLLKNKQKTIIKHTALKSPTFIKPNNNKISTKK